MAGKVFIFFGPRKEFDELLKNHISDDEITVGYLDSIRRYNAKVRASDIATREPKDIAPEYVDNCIVYADDFGSVLSHVIPSFATILDETFEIGTLFVQNPPKRAYKSLLAFHDEQAVETTFYEYPQLKKSQLSDVYDALEKDVLGQRESKRTLITTLYKQSVMTGEKPSALLLYGPSGVGKTQTAKCLSESMGGGLTRIQFSMMQTNEAYEYLFGAEHSKASFARDLLGRESNVILIDEFDKVNPALYNMFYQLFDEGRYVDTNYDVDIRNGLFLLTSNFSSENDAKRRMGSAMFSRITACIPFSDLNDEDKRIIVRRRYEEIVSKLDKEDKKAIEGSDIVEWFSRNVSHYDNMRTMKTKVERAIFDTLSAPLFSEPIGDKQSSKSKKRPKKASVPEVNKAPNSQQAHSEVT